MWAYVWVGVTWKPVVLDFFWVSYLSIPHWELNLGPCKCLGKCSTTELYTSSFFKKYFSLGQVLAKLPKLDLNSLCSLHKPWTRPFFLKNSICILRILDTISFLLIKRESVLKRLKNTLSDFFFHALYWCLGFNSWINGSAPIGGKTKHVAA